MNAEDPESVRLPDALTAALFADHQASLTAADGIAAAIEARLGAIDLEAEALDARLLASLSALSPEMPGDLAGVIEARIGALDIEALDPRVVSALSARSPEMPGDLASLVATRIDGLADEPLDARVVSALSARSPEMPGDLTAAVASRIEGLASEPLPEIVVRALAAECGAGPDASFTAALMTRIEAEVAAELAEGDSPALAQIRAELAAEGERMQSARVVSEVTAEIRSIGPRIEREMPRAVAERIAPPASNVVRLPSRTKHWVGRGIAGAMAMAAALMLYLRAPVPELVPEGLPPLDPGGEVHVDAVRFDGTVTVTESDGVAVIWLSDEPTT